MKILVVDYGVGNIFSIVKSFERLRVETTLNLREDFDAVVLPGVGGFDAALSHIGREELLELVSGVPVLGVCLGMQLFFESSEEGEKRGLGLIKGRVVRFPKNVKCPHMGWSLVRGWGSLLQGEAYFYFAHSYYSLPEDNVVKGVTSYGVEVPAIIEKGNLYGVQFHPEKSGRRGREVLERFLEAVKR